MSASGSASETLHRSGHGLNKLRTHQFYTDADFQATSADNLGSVWIQTSIFGKLKEFKRIALRADKTDQSFAGTIHRAAAGRRNSPLTILEVRL